MQPSQYITGQNSLSFDKCVIKRTPWTQLCVHFWHLGSLSDWSQKWYFTSSLFSKIKINDDDMFDSSIENIQARNNHCWIVKLGFQSRYKAAWILNYFREKHIGCSKFLCQRCCVAQMNSWELTITEHWSSHEKFLHLLDVT